ncbi:MAG: proteasome activator [Ilumatobacter sp.]|uniref:proteasome activator n=1 Tax=Ilumatobacter sp. TaxID=1967498 RepID=UPI003296B5BA
MSNTSDDTTGRDESGPADRTPEAEKPEVVTTGTGAQVEVPADEASSDEDDAEEQSAITEPGKVMRIGSMVKQLLEEVRAADLDEASRERLAEVYERSIVELSSALSPDLQEELRMLSLPFDEDGIPSEAELRVAKAQLVGWLEGLFHGIQASLMAQQFAAQQQLQQMKQIPPGQGQPGHGQPSGPVAPPQTGTYL